MKKVIAVCLAVAAFVVAIPNANAGPPPERNGFFIGFGFGIGNASWDWAIFTPESESETSGVVNIRLGGAIREDIVLGLDAWGWAQKWDLLLAGTPVAELQVTFSAATLAATYFPGNQGAFVRGGIGFGSARTEVKTDLGGGLDASIEGTDTGVALMGAAGYEWRLTQKFALAPQVEVLYLGIDGDVVDGVFEVDAALQFNWYW